MGSNNQLQSHAGCREGKIWSSVLTSRWGYREGGKVWGMKTARQGRGGERSVPMWTWSSQTLAGGRNEETDAGLVKVAPCHPEVLSHQRFLILSGQMHRKHMDLIGFPHPISLSSSQEYMYRFQNEKGEKNSQAGTKIYSMALNKLGACQGSSWSWSTHSNGSGSWSHQ